MPKSRAPTPNKYPRLSPSLWWRFCGYSTREGLSPNQVLMVLVNGYIRGLVDLAPIEEALTREGWFTRDRE